MSSGRHWQHIAVIEGAFLAAVAAAWLLHSPSDSLAPAVPDQAAHAVAPDRDRAAPLAQEASVAAASDVAREASAPLADTAASSAAELCVFGRVEGPDGEAVNGAWVRFQRDGATWSVLSKEGRYALFGMVPGAHRLHEQSVGYLPLDRAVDLAAAPSSQRLDVRLDRSSMIVVRAVLPDGRELATVPREELDGLYANGVLSALASQEPLVRVPLSTEARVTRWLGCEFRPVIYSDREYTYPPEGAIGFLEVRQPPPYHVTVLLRQQVLGSALVAEPVDEVRVPVTIDAVRACIASLALHVVDAETREPLERVVVRSNTLSLVGLSDETGRVLLHPILPGLLDLYAQLDGYATAHRLMRIPAGGEHDVGTIALERPVEIAGRVLTADGAPVEATVLCFDQDAMTFPQPFGGSIDARAKEDGAFRLKGVGRGPHALVFRAKEGATIARGVDTTGGGIEGLDVEVPAGTPVTIERAFEQPLLLQVADGAGLLLSASTWAGDPLELRLSPGDYVARLYDDLTLLETLPFRVGSAPLALSIGPR